MESLFNTMNSVILFFSSPSASSPITEYSSTLYMGLLWCMFVFSGYTCICILLEASEKREETSKWKNVKGAYRDCRKSKFEYWYT